MRTRGPLQPFLKDTHTEGFPRYNTPVVRLHGLHQQETELVSVNQVPRLVFLYRGGSRNTYGWEGEITSVSIPTCLVFVPPPLLTGPPAGGCLAYGSPYGSHSGNAISVRQTITIIASCKESPCGATGRKQACGRQSTTPLQISMFILGDTV